MYTKQIDICKGIPGIYKPEHPSGEMHRFSPYWDLWGLGRPGGFLQPWVRQRALGSQVIPARVQAGKMYVGWDGDASVGHECHRLGGTSPPLLQPLERDLPRRPVGPARGFVAAGQGLMPWPQWDAGAVLLTRAVPWAVGAGVWGLSNCLIAHHRGLVPCWK